MLNPASLQNGNEQYESFTHNRKKYVQYDYRATNGELFSCVKPTLECCRQSRDEWLIQKGLA